jgi:short-subunit dehydrogenase
MLNSKVIWITGASSGLGEEMAYQLSQQGARLILSARREDALEKVRQRCHNPDQHHILPLDLIDVDLHAHIVETALGLFGRIDILINNGGVSQRSLCIDTPLAIERALFEVDFFGTTSLTKALLPHMITHQSGHIVNIASVAGKVGPPFRTSYAAAKHALLGYMDSLRCEVNRHGISVTNICPGFVKTNVSVNALSADGSSFGKVDNEIANGMDVDVCVKRIVRAINNKEKEVVVAQGIARVAYHLRRLLPNTFLGIFQRTADKLLKET